MTESGQLDLVDVLEEQRARAESAIITLEETLNPQLDANPNDTILMEMFDVVTDAAESLRELQDLLTTMRNRDESELP